MKNVWKALGIAALAAAVPVRFKRDKATGQKKFQSLLLSVDVTPNEDGQSTSIGLNIGDGLLTNAVSGLVGAKRETIHFADDDPDAAVVYGEVIDFAQAAADEAQAAADEAQAAADEAQAAVEEASEEDFDPEM